MLLVALVYLGLDFGITYLANSCWSELLRGRRMDDVRCIRDAWIKSNFYVLSCEPVRCLPVYLLILPKSPWIEAWIDSLKCIWRHYIISKFLYSSSLARSFLLFFTSLLFAKFVFSFLLFLFFFFSFYFVVASYPLKPIYQAHFIQHKRSTFIVLSILVLTLSLF